MSSWFQSANIASLAKNALKEAQKTIDKALDINQEHGGGVEVNGSTSTEPSQINNITSTVAGAATDFFTAWGAATSLSPSPQKDIPEFEDEVPANAKINSAVVTSAPITSKPRNINTSNQKRRKTKPSTKLGKSTSSDSTPPAARSIQLDDMVPIDLTSPSTAEASSTLVNLNDDFPLDVDGTLSKNSEGEIKCWEMNQGNELKLSSVHSSEFTPLWLQTEPDIETKNLIDPSTSEAECVKETKTEESFLVITSESTESASSVKKEVEVTNFAEDSERSSNAEKTIEHISEKKDDDLNSENVSQIITNEGQVYVNENESDSEVVKVLFSSSAVIPSQESREEVSIDQSNSEDDETTSRTLRLDSESSTIAATDLESSSGTIIQESCSDENDVEGNNQDFDARESDTPLCGTENIVVDVDNNEEIHDNGSSPKILSPSSRTMSSISVISEEKPEYDSRSPTNSNNSDPSSPNEHVTDYHMLMSIKTSSQHHNPHHQQSSSSTPERGHSRSNSNSTSSSADLQHHNTYTSQPQHRPNILIHQQLQNFQQSGGRIIANFPLSSASSSDIEVIPLDSLDSSTMLYHPGIRRPSVAEVETQTDPTETSPQQQPPVSSKTSNLLAEKDLEISQLREEGEKLSKKQFDLTQIIKKLRAKEKENEGIVRGLKNEIDTKSIEVERVMKIFLQKESIEQKQVQTISKLTNEKTVLEDLINELKSELEDTTENCASMKSSLEEASIEILELQNTISSAQRDTTQIDILTREKSDLFQQNASFQKEIEQLRSSVNSLQVKSSCREQELHTQLAQHVQKIQSLETQLNDVTDEIADATMPLSIEIEKLQNELKTNQNQFQKRERQLQDQLIELNLKLKHSMEREKSSQDYQSDYKTTIKQLEIQAEQLECDNSTLKLELETMKADKANTIKKYENIESQYDDQQIELNKCNCRIEKLEAELKTQSSLFENEKKKSVQLVEQLKQLQQQQSSSSFSRDASEPGTGNTSPVQTIRSNHSSTLSEASYLEEVFESNICNNNVGNPNRHDSSSTTGHLTPKSSLHSIFDSLPMYHQSSSSPYLENLYGQLRLRENELIQLQRESTKNEKIRKILNDEIAKLTVENQQLDEKLEQLNHVESKLHEVEKNYNTVLQLYGEKVEEVEELRLDLADVKEMFKTQIEQLVRK